MFHPREKNVSPEGKSVSVTFYLKPLKNNPTDSSVVARVLYGRKKQNYLLEYVFQKSLGAYSREWGV